MSCRRARSVDERGFIGRTSRGSAPRTGSLGRDIGRRGRPNWGSQSPYKAPWLHSAKSQCHAVVREPTDPPAVFSYSPRVRNPVAGTANAQGFSGSGILVRLELSQPRLGNGGYDG